MSQPPSRKNRSLFAYRETQPGSQQQQNTDGHHVQRRDLRTNTKNKQECNQQKEQAFEAMIEQQVYEAMQYDRRKDVFFFQAEDGIRDLTVTGVQTCALPI